MRSLPLSLLFWACAIGAVLVAAADWDHPCGRASLLPWAAIGAGVFTAVAVYASLRIRPAAAVGISVFIGAAAAGGLLVVFFVHWVGSCTA